MIFSSSCLISFQYADLLYIKILIIICLYLFSFFISIFLLFAIFVAFVSVADIFSSIFCSVCCYSRLRAERFHYFRDADIRHYLLSFTPIRHISPPRFA